jgi:hypothetical protein
MRSLLFIFAVCLIAPCTISAQSPAPRLGAVSGYLSCADTHTPCRYAEVKIKSIQSFAHPKQFDKDKHSFSDEDMAELQSGSFSATTGLDGGFQINSVDPGDYYLTVYLAGYLDPSGLAYSEAQGGGSLSPQELAKHLNRITVSPGLTTTSNLTISRGASLGGTVRFDDGGVASTVAIYLYRKDGTGKWCPYGGMFMGQFSPSSTTTNDRGRWYFSGLPSGSYIIEASLPQPKFYNGIGLGLSSKGSDSLHVFNGDKYRLKEAPAIELSDGEDRSDIDIDIPTTGLNTLQGFITAKPDGRSVTKGAVSLLDPDDKSILRETSIQQDGSFSFNYLASGTYIVQIAAQADGGGVQYETLSVPLLVEGDMTGLSYAVSKAKR